MLSAQKRIAAIHDLSGFGRCSLTVILPVLSVMGHQVCPVPTAVLSAHTGNLGETVFRDLSDYIVPALLHYKTLEIDFDCVYSGFLGSTAQIDHCLKFIGEYKNALAVVDPVMGDHGKPYKTCTEPLRSRMAELVSAADMITPNLTEAYMLLGEDYSERPLLSSQAKSMLVRLAEKGPKYVLITGAFMADSKTSNLGYDSANNMFWRVDYDYLPVEYPGTGDIFASVLIGSLLGSDSLPIAMERATRFLEYAINTTFSYSTDARYGVMFEKTLTWLTETHTLKGYRPL